MFSVDTVLDNKLPTLSTSHPLIRKSLSIFFKYLCHEKAFHQFEENYPHLEGFDFVEQALENFEFGYRVFDREKQRIPVSGRLIIVSNHPLGSLDGLALLKMVGEIRPDVRVIANEILYALTPLRSLLFPVDNISNKTRKENILSIKEWLAQEGAVIFFPAGEVSRFGAKGIRDGVWNSGFLRMAQSTNSPILPIFVNGRNSLFFYALSLLAKPISTLWLVREMFKQSNQHVDIHVGHTIYPAQYQRLDFKLHAKAQLFKKHIYRLGKGKFVLGFEPEYDAVAHPENKQLLKREISECEKLGETADGKKIVLYNYRTNSVVMREIGRLRELTFRTVHEGTGNRRDVDRYDHYYDHIILWDDQDLEIVGAYRMVQSAKALKNAAEYPQLYTQNLFNFSADFDNYLTHGLELGRSFIQPKYWGMRSLDYLWYGIGAYLRKYPEIKYMFGPVSISQSYTDDSMDLLVYFYSTFFSQSSATSEESTTPLVTAKNAYAFSAVDCKSLAKYFVDLPEYKDKFSQLKNLLKEMDQTVPTLYKQYTELCEEGGVTFNAFNIDHDFSDCVDGFILIEIDKIKESKRNRYIGKLDPASKES